MEDRFRNMQEDARRQARGQRQEGEVTIEYPRGKKSGPPSDDDFVDYEEVE